MLVSLVKFYKRLEGQQAEIRIGLQQGMESLAGELIKLFTVPLTMVRLEKKKGKFSLFEILLMNRSFKNMRKIYLWQIITDRDRHAWPPINRRLLFICILVVYVNNKH